MLFFSDTLISIHPPFFTLHPRSHQPNLFFFPSSPSRVRKVSCRFSTSTWRSTAQCTMRPRDLRRSRPLWRTTASCPSMSCSNCYARPRQDTEENITYAHICWCHECTQILCIQLHFCLSNGLTLPSSPETNFGIHTQYNTITDLKTRYIP